jgi:hypothetical protein
MERVARCRLPSLRRHRAYATDDDPAKVIDWRSLQRPPNPPPGVEAGSAPKRGGRNSRRGCALPRAERDEKGPAGPRRRVPGCCAASSARNFSLVKLGGNDLRLSIAAAWAAHGRPESASLQTRRGRPSVPPTRRIRTTTHAFRERHSYDARGGCRPREPHGHEVGHFAHDPAFARRTRPRARMVA